VAETGAGRREQAAKDSTNPPWGAVGMVMMFLVAGAFLTGWHLGRRWGRLMGW
jgi:hypothetical protein